METINGCTVIAPPDTPEPVYLGPAETQGSYVAIVGVYPAGEPGPPPHRHPVLVPRGMRHTVWNSGDEPLHGVILVSPGDAEHVFEPAE